MVAARAGGPVATVVLDRPANRNAQTPATWRALTAVGGRLLADAAVRVVVLRAEGASFSAGLDRAMFTGGVAGEPGLVELAALDEAALDAAIDGFQQAFALVARRPDRVGRRRAGPRGRRRLPARARLRPAGGRRRRRVLDEGDQPRAGARPGRHRSRWSTLVGYSRALEICATGRWVGAAGGRGVGAGHHSSYPSSELDVGHRDLVAALLAAPAEALRATKSAAGPGRVAVLRRAARRGTGRPGRPAARPGEGCLSWTSH